MNIKKFSQLINESNLNETQKQDFWNNFKQNIQNQPIKDWYSEPAYGNNNLPHEERYYGEGFVLENGYKILFHGGGCSGEDCNTTFIISPENKMVAALNW